MLHPDDVVVLAGDTILLSCIAYGTPTPSITWMKDGALLSNSTNITMHGGHAYGENVTFTRSVLQLCTTLEGGGAYSCTADNTTSETFSISVQCEWIAPTVLLLCPT